MLTEPPLLKMNNVSKLYRSHSETVAAIDSANLTINRGERWAVLGPSGSGKSTLLSILGLLDQPDKGHYFFDGDDVSRLDGDTRAFIRNRHIGFVFQSFNLLPRLSSLDNVALPLLYRGISRAEAHELARQQLERIGLGDRLDFRPASLSGGQCQRVAIARALVGQPDLILADEPTGNLDSANAEDIFDLLMSLNVEHKVTLIIVTHDDALAQRMDLQLQVKDGRVA
ncbi:ABC transporter ATP-binding protein [Vreelandella titanicae]|uniref:ABC transporter ATP-binding protein n=1 Tax=Vreelandella titanicae TaxID=664683 RepID=UPI001F259209|nr:ABC transporter ATP-binding protein [Halomonas titanicae]MCE7521260.1 ABC transporter ATP-binding protein [Halomonas titanicae]